MHRAAEKKKREGEREPDSPLFSFYKKKGNWSLLRRLGKSPRRGESCISSSKTKEEGGGGGICLF